MYEDIYGVEVAQKRRELPSGRPAYIGPSIAMTRIDSNPGLTFPVFCKRGKINGPQMTATITFHRVQYEGRRDASCYSGLNDRIWCEVKHNGPNRSCQGRAAIVMMARSETNPGLRPHPTDGRLAVRALTDAHYAMRCIEYVEKVGLNRDSFLATTLPSSFESVQDLARTIYSYCQCFEDSRCHCDNDTSTGAIEVFGHLPR